MITLNISLSSFRLSVQPPSHFPAYSQIHLSTTTRRLSAFESPQLPRPTPDTQQSAPTEIILPPTWKVRWTEHLPDRLAVQAAALIIRVVRPRSPSKRISSLMGCTLSPAPRPLGSLKLSLYSLATGTVCNSFCLRSVNGPLATVTVSFNAVVEQPLQLQLTLSNLVFPVSSTSTQNPTDPDFTTSDHVDQTSQNELVGLSSAFLSVEHDLSRNFVSSDPSPVLPPIDDSFCQNQPSLVFRSLDPLTISAPSLFSLAHSSIKISVYKSPAKTGSERPLKTIDVSLHAIWGALLHPKTTFTYSTPVTTSTPHAIYISAQFNRGPPLGQQVGGITTDDVVTGAKPVIFGTPFAHLSRVPRESDVPASWVHLVDTFGYHFFRHASSNADVWLPPISSSVPEALAADATAANLQGLSRVKDSLYRHPSSGFHVWLHPSAKCIPEWAAEPENDSENEQLQHPIALEEATDAWNARLDDQVDARQSGRGMSSRTTSSFTISTLDALDYHPATICRSVEAIPGCEPMPHDADDVGLLNSTGQPPPIVELRWTQLTGRSVLATGCEGHTLTSMCNRQRVLRFGGSEGSSRTRSNTLQWFDTSTMRWRTVRARGVKPVPRTGHGAVALGSDASRLLIFGGTSSLGRLNDLHVFHTETEMWSPVQFSGTPPEVRARMGMSVTPDGRIALVFGGRSLYRWMGGHYYDPIFVHAFHAERAQWVQMRPRGSGPRPAPRSSCVTEFINERMMVVHGGYEDGSQFFDDTFLFDLASSSWVQLPYPNEETKPEAREGHASTMIDKNTMLICGGDGPSSMLSDINMFDVDKLRWVDRPSIVGSGPGQIVGGAMATVEDGQTIFVGGENGFELPRQTYNLDVSHRSALNEAGLCELVRERGPDARTCVACLDQQVETIFLWCGHSVCCGQCAKQVNKTCPICRKGFSKIVYNTFEGNDS